MFPLIKTETATHWHYKINADFYGLLTCLKGEIMSDGNTHIAITSGKTFTTQSFRDASNFLIERTVKPCFKYLLILMFLPVAAFSQSWHYEQPKLKDYAPSAAFFFAAGMFQGSRDASLFYHVKNGGFFDGRTSWQRKYKNGDYKQGEAFFLSTSVLAPFTDNVHFAPMMANQMDSWGAVMLPVDNNRRFGHLLLKVAAMTALRSAGHFLTYDLLIPNQNR